MTPNPIQVIRKDSQLAPPQAQPNGRRSSLGTCGYNSEKGRNFSCCFEARPTDCRLYSRVSPGTINIFHSLTHAIDEILSDIDVVSD